MEKETLLISSCLYGEYVRYDGDHNKIDNSLLDKLKVKYNLFHFCPEVAGGLPIPRIACEISSLKPLKVIDKNGFDTTDAFILGAQKTLNFCITNKIKKVVLKSNSPSCSSKLIYDGTFSGVKVIGDGVTTQLLKENNIDVFDEYDITKLL